MSRTVLSTMLCALALAAPGCYRSADAILDTSGDSDADSDSDADTDCITGTYDGVDMLVMVDDSGNMNVGQESLPDGVFELVNALMYPDDGSPYDAVDAMRVAVVSSNMGVSYGEDRDVPDDGYVPASLLQSAANCGGRGDDGEFLPIQISSITLGSAVTECPGLDAAFAETTAAAPNGSLALQAACLTQQGTAGCGFEQQLQSAAVALQREDQQSFLVVSHVLAVLLLTNEEDCSMEDAPGLFMTDECQDPTRLNIACNVDEENESYLFAPSYFHDAFVAAKGNASAVVFAAIAGVPFGDQDGAAECEGRGDALGDCLDQDAMQMVPYEDTSMGSVIWRFSPACTSNAADQSQALTAVPGRRYVKLANELFGARGYVSSICNPDWTPAMTDIAELIAERIESACE
jgi:hypothetical protein